MRGALLMLLATIASIPALSCAAETPPPPAAPAPVASAPAPPPAPLPPPPAPVNPFFQASTLLYEAPPFDRIHDSDYEPAYEKGMSDHLAEIAAVAAQAEAPTFENTIVAMERSGR